MWLLLACGAVRSPSFEADTGGGIAVEEPRPPCLDAALMDALAGMLLGLDAVARTVDLPPDLGRIPVFYEVPGASGGPWFYLDLPAPCPDAAPDPFCSGPACHAPTCTKAGWETLSTPDPSAKGPWTYADTEQQVGWLGKEPILYLAGQVNATHEGGAAISGTSYGRMDGYLTFNASYQVTSGGNTWDVSVSVTGSQGEVEVASMPAATWDGAVLAAEECIEYG